MARVTRCMIVFLTVVTPGPGLRAQVPAVTVLDSAGFGAAEVANPFGDSVSVSVEVWRAASDSTAVPALIAPATFSLSPGARQRVLLRSQALAPGDTVRLVITFDPVVPEPGKAKTITTRLLTRYRVVAKLTRRGGA